MALQNAYVLAGFETLHFVQKSTFFNRFYFLQAFWSFLFVLSLPLNNDKYQGFPWDEDMLAPAHGFLFGASIPLYKIKPGAYYAVFGVSIFILIFTALLCAYVSNAIVKSALEKTWLATWFRVCCGFLATFWLPVLRIFLAPMDCDYFGQIYPYGNPSGELKMQDVINLNWSTKEDDGRAKVDELCNSGAGGFALWGSCILVVIVFCLAFAFQSLAHVNDPRSWSALARPHCLMDLYNNIGISVLTIAFVVLRGYPAVLGFFFFVHQFTAFLFCVLTQPYYDARTTNFRSAMFAASSWVGLTFFVVSFADRGSSISSAMTVAMYIGFFASLPAGYFLSNMRYKNITGYEWDRIVNQYCDESESDDQDIKMRNMGQSKDAKSMQNLRESIDEGNFEINKSLKEIRDQSSRPEVPSLWEQGYTTVSAGTDKADDNNPVFARTSEDSNKYSIPEIQDRQLRTWLADYYNAGVSQGIFEWLGSLYVEVSIRKLYFPKKNNITEQEKHHLDIADLILKWGMMRYPQSTYLRLQLMVLKVYRNQMVAKESQGHSAGLQGPTTRLTNERTDLVELEEMGLTLDLQFSVFRKKKDLDHMNDSIGGQVGLHDCMIAYLPAYVISCEHAGPRHNQLRGGEEEAEDGVLRAQQVLARHDVGVELSQGATDSAEDGAHLQPAREDLGDRATGAGCVRVCGEQGDCSSRRWERGSQAVCQVLERCQGRRQVGEADLRQV
jgi:hypothetical protein